MATYHYALPLSDTLAGVDLVRFPLFKIDYLDCSAPKAPDCTVSLVINGRPLTLRAHSRRIHVIDDTTTRWGLQALGKRKKKIYFSLFEIPPFLDLIDDIIHLIMLHLPYSVLEIVRRANKKLLGISDKPEFWRQRLVMDFGHRLTLTRTEDYELVYRILSMAASRYQSQGGKIRMILSLGITEVIDKLIEQEGLVAVINYANESNNRIHRYLFTKSTTMKDIGEMKGVFRLPPGWMIDLEDDSSQPLEEVAKTVQYEDSGSENEEEPQQIDGDEEYRLFIAKYMEVKSEVQMIVRAALVTYSVNILTRVLTEYKDYITPMVVDEDIEDALCESIIRGDVEYLTLALAPSTGLQIESGIRFLLQAAKKNTNYRIMEFFLNNFANISKAEREDLLISAAKGNDIHSVRVLIKDGVPTSAINKCLVHAVVNRNAIELVELLLDNGGECDFADTIVRNCPVIILEYLIDRGFPIKSRLGSLLIETKDQRMLSFLLDLKPNQDQKEEALQIAAMRGQEGKVEILVRAGAKGTLVGHSGITERIRKIITAVREDDSWF